MVRDSWNPNASAQATASENRMFFEPASIFCSNFRLFMELFESVVQTHLKMKAVNAWMQRAFQVTLYIIAQRRQRRTVIRYVMMLD